MFITLDFEEETILQQW